MLKISKAISPKQAKRYYQSELQKDLEASRGNTIGGESIGAERSALTRYQGEWYGRLAEEMGLRGEVRAEQFERLCDGVHPETCEAMIRHASAKTYTNRKGKEITSMTHRAGWDATFSAPKSTSLCAIVGGDERIREAHRESVRKALDELERYGDARIGGKNVAERTGKLVCALFEHDAARPDRTSGYAAPQLHTHAVIFNVTETEKGVTKPLQPIELYRTQQYATAVYRVELADRLQKLGYEIEIDSKTRAPEIKGFSREYLQESSLRSQEIQQESEQIKNRFKLEGGKIKNDAGIRQVAAWQSRESKGFDPEEMKTRALELEVKYDFQSQRVVGQAVQNSFRYDSAAERQNACNAIDCAKESASWQVNIHNNPSKNSLFNERRFLTEALRNGIGKTNFEEIRNEYNSRAATGEFSHLIKNEKSTREITTLRASTENKIEISQAINQGNSPSQEGKRTVPLREEREVSEDLTELSMNYIENEVRQRKVEKEVSHSVGLLFAN